MPRLDLMRTLSMASTKVSGLTIVLLTIDRNGISRDEKLKLQKNFRLEVRILSFF